MDRTQGLPKPRSSLAAAFAFVQSRNGHHLKGIDFSWSGFFRAVFLGFVVSLLLSLISEWLEVDPDFRFLDHEHGWIVIIIGEVISIGLGLLIWYAFSRFFGWMSLFRKIVVYLNWLFVILAPPLFVLGQLLHHGMIAWGHEGYSEGGGGALIFLLSFVIPLLVYSVLCLWRGCDLSLRISLLTVLLFTCLDFVIRYKVLVLSWFYLQSGATLS